MDVTPPRARRGIGTPRHPSTTQKSGALSSLWIGDQHNGKIIHIEPLTP
jgi:hypothetical protein